MPMSSDQEIIYRPEFSEGYDFNIWLDKRFAKKMIGSHSPKEYLKRMNELGNEELKKFRIFYRDPYSFYNDSGMITQIYVGNNGVWLSTDNAELFRLGGNVVFDRPIEFHSHNVRHQVEAYVLLRLFDKWVQYSECLRNP